MIAWFEDCRTGRVGSARTNGFVVVSKRMRTHDFLRKCIYDETALFLLKGGCKKLGYN